MADKPAPSTRGRSKRGGLGKYLRARGRRGSGRPAEFGKRLVLEEEQEDEGSEDEDDPDAGKYVKRQLGTNADRYEEPEVDPHVEQEPEPEVDLSSFLARQRLETQDDSISNHEDEDDIDLSLAHLPSSLSHNTRKGKAQRIEWDASMDQLKREKEAAEAVWDLKTRFRKNQPRLATAHGTTSRREQRTVPKVEDARHIQKPPELEADHGDPGSEPLPANKADMEGFLDDLLS